MKKFISAAAALVLAAVPVITLTANAVNDDYKPLFYMTVQDNPAVTQVSDNTVKISRDALDKGDVSLNIDVRISDETKKCSFVTAKLRSLSDYIEITDYVNPALETDTEKEYTIQTDDGVKTFSTKYLPFCYGSFDEETGEYSNFEILAGEADNGQSFFSAFMNSLDTLPVYTSETDYFPLGQFEASVDKDTPDGEYTIQFATTENTEGGALVTTYCFIRYDMLNTSNITLPRVNDLKIIVGDPKKPENPTQKPTQAPTQKPTQPATQKPTEPDNTSKLKLGDVNFDGAVNAVDASLVLGAYANVATGKPSGFSDDQVFVGDVNKDNDLNSLDASVILSYYAYTATGGTDSLEKHLGYEK